MEAVTVGIAIAASVNLAGIIWGASQLSGAVDQLRKITEKLECNDERRQREIENHNLRLDRLERLT